MDQVVTVPVAIDKRKELIKELGLLVNTRTAI
jgi:hypothetical protein